MSTLDRPRLIFHGAIVLLVGLFSGLPTTVESLSGLGRSWHTAHEALIMMGIWMFAESSVLNALVLERREASALVWSLVTMGYGFTAALVLGGATGTNVFGPGDTPVSIVAFLTAAIGILGAITAAALTLMGARAALQAARRGA